MSEGVLVVGVPEKRILRLPLSPKSVSWPRCGPRDEAGATAGVMGGTDIAAPLSRRHFTSSQGSGPRHWSRDPVPASGSCGTGSRLGLNLFGHGLDKPWS